MLEVTEYRLKTFLFVFLSFLLHGCYHLEMMGLPVRVVFGSLEEIRPLSACGKDNTGNRKPGQDINSKIYFQI